MFKGRLNIINILWTVILVCLTSKSLVGLLLFGTVVTGFISKMENLEFNPENTLMVAQKRLEMFRKLKTGFGPYLFALFSVHTLALVAIVFLAVDFWKEGVNTQVLISFALIIFFTGLPLLYTVLLAKSAHSKFQNILPILRYFIISKDK